MVNLTTFDAPALRQAVLDLFVDGTPRTVGELLDLLSSAVLGKHRHRNLVQALEVMRADNLMIHQKGEDYHWSWHGKDPTYSYWLPTAVTAAQYHRAAEAARALDMAQAVQLADAELRMRYCAEWEQILADILPGDFEDDLDGD